jgi:undecaprenyl-diphosphatase
MSSSVAAPSVGRASRKLYSAEATAGMLLGLPAVASAEYSFLLALPTLGAATLLDMGLGGPGLIHSFGWPAVTAGFISAMAVATVAIGGFIRYLTSRGLAPFGWYRIGLALAVLFFA